MSAGQMPWNDAIIKVLERANRPLHYDEITRQIEELRLRSVTGATPNRTVNSHLGQLIVSEKVARTGPGLYTLPKIAECAEREQRAEEKNVYEKHSNPDTLTVKAYGLFWARTVVNWNNGELWGRQTENSTLVNFADQIGIYLLHSWNEIVYVGQTNPPKGESGLYRRLTNHHNDRERKSERWDSFSWFGFRAVKQDGSLGEAPNGVNLNDLIDVMETIFIEALMPRLNMQTGPGSKPLRELGLYFQASVQNAARSIR